MTTFYILPVSDFCFHMKQAIFYNEELTAASLAVQRLRIHVLMQGTQV